MPLWFHLLIGAAFATYCVTLPAVWKTCDRRFPRLRDEFDSLTPMPSAYWDRVGLAAKLLAAAIAPLVALRWLIRYGTIRPTKWVSFPDYGEDD